MRTCPDCNKVFEYSKTDRHLKRAVCRAPKVKCPCGRNMQYTSKCCKLCSDIETSKRTGLMNHNWKGGKVRHQAGYIMRCFVGHPRANTSKRYVFEHILVMEEFLGRYLFSEENVHHKNGVKDDNRIENLELWVKPQPSGIRVEDAVKWAKEILERYEKKASSHPF